MAGEWLSSIFSGFLSGKGKGFDWTKFLETRLKQTKPGGIYYGLRDFQEDRNTERKKREEQNRKKLDIKPWYLR